MIVFDFKTIVASLLSALLFGLFFTILYTIVIIISNVAFIFCSLILSPQTINDSKKLDSLLGNLKTSPLGIKVIFIFLFGIGFSLLSYIALDGIIRLYMVVLSIFAFFLPEYLLLQKMRHFLLSRILSLAIKIANLFAKMQKNLKKRAKNIQKSENIALK